MNIKIDIVPQYALGSKSSAQLQVEIERAIQSVMDQAIYGHINTSEDFKNAQDYLKTVGLSSDPTVIEIADFLKDEKKLEETLRRVKLKSMW